MDQPLLAIGPRLGEAPFSLRAWWPAWPASDLHVGLQIGRHDIRRLGSSAKSERIISSAGRVRAPSSHRRKSCRSCLEKGGTVRFSG